MVSRLKIVPLEKDPTEVKIVPVGAKPDLTDSGWTAFGMGMADRMLANLGNLPFNAAEGAADFLLGVPPPIEAMADRAGIDTPMDRVQGALDPMRPSDATLPAILSAIPGGERFAEFSGEVREQNPMADSAGVLAGDVATLFGLRKPVKNVIERQTGKTAGGIMDEFVDAALNRVSNKAAAGAKGTGIRREIQELVDGDNFRLLARGAGRAGEAGLEGAVLAAMQDEDPYVMAGLSAGAQGLSSLSLTAGSASVEMPAKILFKQDVGKITKYGAALAIQGSILAAWLNLFGDNPDAATEQAFDKLGFGLIAALALGLPGKRPKDDGVLKNFPSAADIVLTVPRAGMHQAMQELHDDPRAKAVVELMETDPERMGEPEMRRMARAAEEGTLVDWFAQVYDKYNLADTENGMPAAAAAIPVKKRRNRGIGFQ